jgi:hypothetical protein
VRIFWLSTCETEASIRLMSWVPDISIEKMTTGNALSTATCSAMFSARAVLPIEGARPG